jgi:hypothetical protein
MPIMIADQMRVFLDLIRNLAISANGIGIANFFRIGEIFKPFGIEGHRFS